MSGYASVSFKTLPKKPIKKKKRNNQAFKSSSGRVASPKLKYPKEKRIELRKNFNGD